MKSQKEYAVLIEEKKQEKLRLSADMKAASESLCALEAEAADAVLWGLCDPGTRAAAAALPASVLQFMGQRGAKQLEQEPLPFGWPSETSPMDWDLTRRSPARQGIELTLLGRAALIVGRNGRRWCGLPETQEG